MRQLALTTLSAVLVAVGVTATAAPSASAFVRTCSGPAYTGCISPDGYHSYIESRSSKTGGAAAHVCTALTSVNGAEGAECAYNGTFKRICYYGGLLVYGLHWGSSNEWTINGRDATVSDATTC